MPLALEVRDAVRALARPRRSLPLALLDRPFPVTAAGTAGTMPTAVVPMGETAIASAFSPIEMIVMAEMAMVVETAAMLETAVMLEAKIVTKIAPALAASERFAVRGERAVHPAPSEPPAHAAATGTAAAARH